MNTAAKIRERDELVKIVEKLKGKGKIIVTTNGTFDILHIGHIKFLEEARSQGDILIVATNSDSSVKQNKGPTRPINNEKDRARMLAALQCVDYVTVFSEKAPIELLDKLKPNVHVNGSDYGENCIEAPTVKKNGGKMYIVKLVPGYSTTGFLNRIKII
ncbi:adenylyltransferase/cytidyltransferase family protein [Candidatus Woesearchaeota archaeon]|nr:adenylyltransferase/cytidyltransferase family protein [Candidatus Woesearchaeota archaeon]